MEEEPEFELDDVRGQYPVDPAVWCRILDTDNASEEIYFPKPNRYLVLLREGFPARIAPVRLPSIRTTKAEAGDPDDFDEESALLDDSVLYSAERYQELQAEGEEGVEGPDVLSVRLIYQAEGETKVEVERTDLPIGLRVQLGPVTIVVRGTFEETEEDRKE